MHVYVGKSSNVTYVIISEVHAAVLKIREFSSYRLLCNIILCVLCHTSGLKQLCRNPTAASETQHVHTLGLPADHQTYQAIKNPQECASQSDTNFWEEKNETKHTICSSTSAWDCGRHTDIKLITTQEW